MMVVVVVLTLRSKTIIMLRKDPGAHVSYFMTNISCKSLHQCIQDVLVTPHLVNQFHLGWAGETGITGGVVAVYDVSANILI